MTRHSARVLVCRSQFGVAAAKTPIQHAIGLRIGRLPGQHQGELSLVESLDPTVNHDPKSAECQLPLRNPEDHGIPRMLSRHTLHTRHCICFFIWFLSVNKRCAPLVIILTKELSRKPSSRLQRNRSGAPAKLAQCFGGTYGKTNSAFECLPEAPPNSLIHKSQYIWTSIDDILVHRGSAQDGWRDADPRNLLYVSENNDIDWEDQHPNGKDPVVAVRADTQKASAVPMNGIEGQVVCRSIEDEVLKPTPTTQLRPDFPLTLPVLTNSDPSSDGCHQSSTEPTLIACAIRCQRNIQCRSMYYNAEDHTCVHMLYVDARLPSVFRLKSEEWKRYAKTAIISKSAAR
ncbi:hypothetical protein CLF_101570 [Clonorchis sinensis]|uniref:Apple domain-containing protein n=1 Tax=Clonorchis sinensis TaxID=79923 RepID=G7Y621_CLOSI|nr:hypothetical protein CLF_101570 [Clonorchis sinensis]